MRMIDLDLPFAVSEIGDAGGLPLVVLPGGPCRGPEYLGDLGGAGGDRRLIVLHPRGTPRSPGLSRGWWTDADDVITLADALGLPAIDVLAHSAGTRLALATATRHPDRVRSLALVTPPASWLTGTPHDGDQLPLDRGDPAVVAALASLANDDADSTATDDASFTDLFRTQAPATYATWTAATRQHAMVGAVSLAAAAAWFADIPTDAVERIRRAPRPATLVVGGDADQLTGVRPVMDYAAALSAELTMLDDCGHYPWVEQPAAFASVIDAWLARLPLPRG